MRRVVRSLFAALAPAAATADTAPACETREEEGSEESAHDGPANAKQDGANGCSSTDSGSADAEAPAAAAALDACDDDVEGDPLLTPPMSPHPSLLPPAATAAAGTATLLAQAAAGPAAPPPTPALSEGRTARYALRPRPSPRLGKNDNNAMPPPRQMLSPHDVLERLGGQEVCPADRKDNTSAQQRHQGRIEHNEQAAADAAVSSAFFAAEAAADDASSAAVEAEAAAAAAAAPMDSASVSVSAADALDMRVKDVEEASVRSLRAICAELGLPRDGPKNALRARALAALEMDASDHQSRFRRPQKTFAGEVVQDTAAKVAPRAAKPAARRTSARRGGRSSTPACAPASLSTDTARLAGSFDGPEPLMDKGDDDEENKKNTRTVDQGEDERSDWTNSESVADSAIENSGVLPKRRARKPPARLSTASNSQRAALPKRNRSSRTNTTVNSGVLEPLSDRLTQGHDINTANSSRLNDLKADGNDHKDHRATKQKQPERRRSPSIGAAAMPIACHGHISDDRASQADLGAPVLVAGSRFALPTHLAAGLTESVDAEYAHAIPVENVMVVQDDTPVESDREGMSKIGSRGGERATGVHLANEIAESPGHGSGAVLSHPAANGPPPAAETDAAVTLKSPRIKATSPKRGQMQAAAAQAVLSGSGCQRRVSTERLSAAHDKDVLQDSCIPATPAPSISAMYPSRPGVGSGTPEESIYVHATTNAVQLAIAEALPVPAPVVDVPTLSQVSGGVCLVKSMPHTVVGISDIASAVLGEARDSGRECAPLEHSPASRALISETVNEAPRSTADTVMKGNVDLAAGRGRETVKIEQDSHRPHPPPPPTPSDPTVAGILNEQVLGTRFQNDVVTSLENTIRKRPHSFLDVELTSGGPRPRGVPGNGGSPCPNRDLDPRTLEFDIVDTACGYGKHGDQVEGTDAASERKQLGDYGAQQSPGAMPPPGKRMRLLSLDMDPSLAQVGSGPSHVGETSNSAFEYTVKTVPSNSNGGSSPPCERLVRVPTRLEKMAEPYGGQQGISSDDRTKGFENVHLPSLSKGMPVFSAGLQSRDSNCSDEFGTTENLESRAGCPRVARLPRYGPSRDTRLLDITRSRRGMGSTSPFNGHPQPILPSTDASIDDSVKAGLQKPKSDLTNEADNTLQVFDEERPGVLTPSKKGSSSKALMRDQENPTQDTSNWDSQGPNHPVLQPEPFRQKSTGFVTPDDIIRTLQNRASRSASHSFPIPRCSGSRRKSGFSDFNDIDKPLPGSAFQPPSTRRTGSKIRQVAAALSSPSPYRGLGESARGSSIASQKDDVAALPRPSGLVSLQKRGASSASGGLVSDLRPADTGRIGYTPGERIAVNSFATRCMASDENGELNRNMLPAAFGGDQSAAMSSSARRILETLDRVTKENRVRVVKRNRSPLGLPSRGKRQRLADVGGMDGGLSIGGTEWFVNTIERHAAEAAAHANANDLRSVSVTPGPKTRAVSYMSGDEGDPMNANVPRLPSKERLPASLGDRRATVSKGGSSFVPYPKAEGIAKKRRHTEKKFASKSFAAAAKADYGSLIHEEQVRSKTVEAEDAKSAGAEQTCKSGDISERLPSFSFKPPPPSTTGKPHLPLFSFGEGTRKEGDLYAPSTKSPIFGSSQVDTLPETQASHHITEPFTHDREANVSAGSDKTTQKLVDAEQLVGDDAATSADVNRNGASPRFGVSTNADDAHKIVQDSSVPAPTIPQPLGGEAVSAFGTLGTSATLMSGTRHADFAGFHFNVPRENVAPPISSFEDHPDSTQVARFPDLCAAPERTSVDPSTTALFAETIDRTGEKLEKSVPGVHESATQSSHDAVDSKRERVDDRAVVEANQTSFPFMGKDGDHVNGAENVASSKLDCPEPSSLSAPSPAFSEPNSVLHASVSIVDKNSDKAEGEMTKSFANEGAVDHQSGPGVGPESSHLKDLDEAAPSIDVIPQSDTRGTVSVFSRLKGASLPESPALGDGSCNLLPFATPGSGNLLFGAANRDAEKPLSAPESQRAPSSSPASGGNHDLHGSEAESMSAPVTFSFGAITKEASPATSGSGSNSIFGQVATNPFSGNPSFSDVPAFGAQVSPAATGNPFSTPGGVLSGLLPPPPRSELPAASGVPAFGAQVSPAATSNPFSSPAGIFPGSLPPPLSAEQPAPSKLFTFGAVTAPAQPVSTIQAGLGQSTAAATGAPFSTLPSTQNTPFDGSIGGTPGPVFGETFAQGQSSSTSGLFGTSASVVPPSLGAFGAASHTLPAPSPFGSASVVPSPAVFGSPPTLPSSAPFGIAPGGNVGMPSTLFGSLPQSTPALQFGQPTGPPAFGVSAPAAFGMPSAPAGSEGEQPGFSMGSSAAPTRRRVLRGKRSIR